MCPTVTDTICTNMSSVAIVVRLRYRPEPDLVISIHASVGKHLGNILDRGTAGTGGKADWMREKTKTVDTSFFFKHLWLD